MTIKTIKSVSKYLIPVLLLSVNIYTVPAGHRAVIFNRVLGVSDSVVGEGSHLRLNLIQKPFCYDVRIRPYLLKKSVITKDLQTVQLTLRVLYQPETASLVQLHRVIGPEFENRLLPSLIGASALEVMGRFELTQLLSRRDDVCKQTLLLLRQHAHRFGICVHDSSMISVDYTDNFVSAVERKVIEEQRVEQMKHLVEKEKELARADVIIAEGESRAVAMINSAVSKSGGGLMSLRKLEAAEQMVHNMAGNANITYVK